MIFTESNIKGCFVLEVNRIGDDRGFFGRLWCEKEMQDMGLVSNIAQSNVGYSKETGTQRGLHFQIKPHEEVKIVRCTRGRMFDVVVDLRKDSETYLQWFGAELTPENGKMIYVPEGCATGYRTLVDDTEMCYLTSEFYAAEHAMGIMYNDPKIGIEWPGEVSVISEADKNWPNIA